MIANDFTKKPQRKIAPDGFWVDLEPNSKGPVLKSELDTQLRSRFDKFLDSFFKEICGLDGCLWILPPMLGNGQFVDLLKLFLAVSEKGGYGVVSENGLWDLVAQEFGLGLNLAPTVKLVYIKYLDSLERWLERLLVDGIGLNAELSDRGVNVGGALMELGAEFKGLLSEMPENEFLDLNVNAEVESYESEKFAEDEESLHIDSTKSGVDFVEVGESGDNVVKSFMMDGSFSNEDVKGKDVDENLISDSRKSEKVENEDEVKSVVVVVETDGDEEGNKGDNSEIEELDLATFEESVSSRKRKRDSIYRMLNWVTEIAKDPCDPEVGSLPEWSKWKSYGNEECWKQVLVTREMLFLKRNADSTSSAEGFVKQVSITY